MGRLLHCTVTAVGVATLVPGRAGGSGGASPLASAPGGCKEEREACKSPPLCTRRGRGKRPGPRCHGDRDQAASSVRVKGRPGLVAGLPAPPLLPAGFLRSRRGGGSLAWPGSCGPPGCPPGMANHLRFVARTVMVPNGNVEAAYRVLNRVLTMDGVIEESKRRRYYEKPCRKRNREAYETCRRIYNMEMARKISFLTRRNRVDPWLGC